MKPPSKHMLMGVGVSPARCQDVLSLCRFWIEHPSTHGRSIAFLTVHSLMSAVFDPSYRAVLNSMDIDATDGMPLVWALRSFGFRKQERVYGPDLMLALCGQAAKLGYPVFLYGGRTDVLTVLQRNLTKRFPGLQIADAYAPPFRTLTPEEDRHCIQQILNSAAKLVFVGIGTPKQDRWMSEHSSKLPGVVMLGVGAAFDFHAGRVRQAPVWMQQKGLEWFFRLLMEPRRLWKRYLLNPLFLVMWGLERAGVPLIKAASK
jgi:N-acetylglucosaminyldiphosphoundecaprenol N-acetyl-beta-D-mannosaminyltransferase